MPVVRVVRAARTGAVWAILVTYYYVDVTATLLQGVAGKLPARVSVAATRIMRYCFNRAGHCEYLPPYCTPVLRG